MAFFQFNGREQWEGVCGGVEQVRGVEGRWNGIDFPVPPLNG
jgi:hypothetical protein